MKPKVKVSLQILPFGSMHYEIIVPKFSVEERGFEIPKYIEPPTTHIEIVKIQYENNETYLVPKTTIGF